MTDYWDFNRSKYLENGVTKYLATTQFEAADARRAFVCWDEPQAKATFEISIIADKNKNRYFQHACFHKKTHGKQNPLRI